MLSVARTILVSTAACILSMAAIQSPEPPVAASFENEYVKVTVAPPLKTPPGSISDCFNLGFPVVRVFIPAEISSSHSNDSETTNVSRIRAFYLPIDEMFRCSGSQYWSEVFVQLKSVPPKVKFKDDAIDLDSAHNQVLLDNGLTRVLYFHLGPGETEPVVDQRARVIVGMTDSKEILTSPDGKAEQRTIKAGEVSFGKAGREATKNAGSTTLRNIVVELKSPQ